MTAIIVDTSAILALFDESYEVHRDVARVVAESADLLVVSPLIVAEADYMLATRLGSVAARHFAGDVAAEAYELADWTAAAHAEALEVTNQFAHGKDYVGMADASNVILADRYRTTRVLTLDQRHFRELKPLWGADHFQLLPFDR